MLHKLAAADLYIQCKADAARETLTCMLELTSPTHHFIVTTGGNLLNKT